MTKATLIKADYLENVLRGSQPMPGKNNLEPFNSLSKELNLPLNILEDVSVKSKVETHLDSADLWLCLEGEANFICGGEIANPYFSKLKDGTDNPREIRGGEISGGEHFILKRGDWLFIPAGMPHQHFADGVARLMIIKIPNK